MNSDSLEDGHSKEIAKRLVMGESKILKLTPKEPAVFVCENIEERYQGRRPSARKRMTYEELENAYNRLYEKDVENMKFILKQANRIHELQDRLDSLGIKI